MKAALPLVLILLSSAAMAQTDLDRGSFGPFTRSLNTRPYGYAVVPDPTGNAPAPLVERFEVRPDDCETGPGWSDCANDRERSELTERGARNPEGSEWWYGWSLYVPADTPNIYPTKTAFGQFHQEGLRPVWMFQNKDGGYHLDDQVAGQTTRYIPLIEEADLRGRWHRIEVHAKWSRGADGVFQVWVNGTQKVDHHGPTMSAPLVFFKYGVYRSFLSRYKEAKGTDAVPAQTAYYANVRRAATREGLNASAPYAPGQ